MTLISDNYICRSCRRQEIGLPAATRLQGLLDDREVRLGQRRSRVGADEKMRDRPLIFQSFQKHLGETADVSLTLETFPICKYPSPLESLRNRTQEADGSIPFISTIFIRFFLRKSV